MNASSIILAHNHPSENLAPSQADLNLTRRLKKGGELLDISVLDHLIITRRAYYSFPYRRFLQRISTILRSMTKAIWNNMLASSFWGFDLMELTCI